MVASSPGKRTSGPLRPRKRPTLEDAVGWPDATRTLPGSCGPGLFLFLRTRPNLLRRVWRIGYCVGRHLNHYVSIATECVHSHPRAARSIGACAMVAVAGVGTLHAFCSLFAIAILSGTLKAAYSAVQIAFMIAAVRGAVEVAANVRRAGCAVVRHADVTKQKLISPKKAEYWPRSRSVVRNPRWSWGQRGAPHRLAVITGRRGETMCDAGPRGRASAFARA
jgi:hypothetical protein